MPRTGWAEQIAGRLAKGAASFRLSPAPAGGGRSLSRQIIAVAFVEGYVERPHQPAGRHFFVKELGIGEREPFSRQGVLNRQLRGVEDEAAIDRQVGAPDRPRHHFPEEMPRPILDLDMQEIAGGDEARRIGALDALQQARAAQDGAAHHP
jgi:hypothetical protein